MPHFLNLWSQSFFHLVHRCTPTAGLVLVGLSLLGDAVDYVTASEVGKLVDVDKKGRGHLRWIGEQDFGK